MTVNELLARLGAAFPAFNARALEAWAPVYRARLGRHEGPVLAKAFADTLGSFTVRSSKALFPMPADFDAYLPSGRIDMGREPGKKLDLAARKRRADSLFADWQQGQCRRADKGNPMLRRALENVARQVADTLGWDENPKPLVLTRDQLKTACQSAISQERRIRYGKPPADKHLWWRQIRAVADDWGVRDGEQAITPEWWDVPTGKAFGADAAPDGDVSHETRLARDMGSSSGRPQDMGQAQPAPPPRDGALLAALADRHRAEGRHEYAEQLDRQAGEMGHRRPTREAA